MKRDDLFSHFAIKSGRHFQKSINTLNALFGANATQETAYKTEKYLFHVIRFIIIFSAEEHVHITGNLYKQIVIDIIAEITFFYSFCKELLILVFILSSYHLKPRRESRITRQLTKEQRIGISIHLCMQTQKLKQEIHNIIRLLGK